MTRRHDIDALRALAFAMLVLYHFAMLYVGGEDWGWHTKSTHTAEWLQAPMLFVNRWRMSLIFLISGVSSALLLARGRPGFLRTRTRRLLIPLAFGILVIVPVQPYVQGIGTGYVQPGYLDFLAEYYTGRSWPEGAFDGHEHGYTWNHLWYLAYLWTYTLALVLVLPALHSGPGRRLQQATGLRGWALLLVPAIPLAIETVGLQGRFEDTGDLIHDGYRNALYFTVFLYGFWMAQATALWDELARLRRRSLAYALALFAVYFALVRTLPDDPGDTAVAIVWTLRSLYIWAAIAALLGWYRALLDRPWRWLPWANEAVFPWYVLHQSVIILLAYWIVPLQWPAWIEVPVILTGTIALCWAGFAIIRRVPVLRPLFGLKTRQSTAATADATATPSPTAA